jgi:ABC-type phosphate transport system substrate-binding protein
MHMMMRKTLLKLALPLLTALAAPLAHADIFVIVNGDTPVTGADVRDIFIGEKQVAGSVKLVPIDNSAMQAQFLEKVLKLNQAKYETLWTKKSFREGLNAPAVKGSDAEVIGAVKSTPGAVGYVGAAPAGVKVIQKY